MQGYEHMKHEHRIKMEALLKAKLSKAKIAAELGFSRSTINREYKRGLCDKMLYDLRVIKVYDAHFAQRDYDYKATSKGSQLKIGNDYEFLEFVERKIVNDKFSPDAVVGYIKTHDLSFKGMVCTRTLYNYIDAGDIFPHVTRQSLWMKGQRKRNYDAVKRVRIKKPLVKSIEDRPKEILTRDECGHWEMDTVIGKSTGKNPVLLVLTERKSRHEIIRKIPSKTQDAVARELDELELKTGSSFREIFKSITIDNGSEFLNESLLERSVNGGKRTDVYYCHPNCSFERGSNENLNKMIRRFVPKGDDIGNYSSEYIADTQAWINNYPRKILGYYSSSEVFAQSFGFVI